MRYLERWSEKNVPLKKLNAAKETFLESRKYIFNSLNKSCNRLFQIWFEMNWSPFNQQKHLSGGVP